MVKSLSIIEGEKFQIKDLINFLSEIDPEADALSEVGFRFAYNMDTHTLDVEHILDYSCPNARCVLDDEDDDDYDEDNCNIAGLELNAVEEDGLPEAIKNIAVIEAICKEETPESLIYAGIVGSVHNNDGVLEFTHKDGCGEAPYTVVIPDMKNERLADYLKLAFGKDIYPTGVESIVVDKNNKIVAAVYDVDIIEADRIHFITRNDALDLDKYTITVAQADTYDLALLYAMAARRFGVIASDYMMLSNNIPTGAKRSYQGFIANYNGNTTVFVIADMSTRTPAFVFCEGFCDGNTLDYNARMAAVSDDAHVMVDSIDALIKDSEEFVKIITNQESMAMAVNGSMDLAMAMLESVYDAYTDEHGTSNIRCDDDCTCPHESCANCHNPGQCEPQDSNESEASDGDDD